ncbi:MAG: prepilin peptidase [Pirellulaceae bacterium]|nr:prepilin peptidase [Pirellulaceae bacterium]
MDQILSIPLEVRLVLLFLLGACIGGAVNWAIYTLAWFPRPISPWAKPAPEAPPRRPTDRIPVLGWLGLQRESHLHGPGFWLRPMLLEIIVGFGIAWLYWWEVEAFGLLPAEIVRWLPRDAARMLHLQFAAHAVLITLMLAGSMIDVDEKIIPDEITVTGTLLGLLLAAAWPWSMLPDVIVANQRIEIDFLRLTSPNVWPEYLNGRPVVWPLLVALGCWWLWCAALLPRTWHRRHGWLRAVRLCCARIVRERVSYRILRMAVFGALLVVLVWFRGGPGWHGLLSSLVGMAAGGGLIWLVRIIGGAALGREAMGFGDVTLMAMIGAFLGWQPCMVIFFLAPLAGVVVGLLRLLLMRDKEIPYGPFLCLATLFVIVFWNGVWDYVQGVFGLGWLIPAVMVVCLALMGAMLGAWRLILGIIRGFASKSQ